MKFGFIWLYWSQKKICSLIQLIWFTRIGKLFFLNNDSHRREMGDIFFLSSYICIENLATNKKWENFMEMLDLSFFCQMIIAQSHFGFGHCRMDKHVSEKSGRRRKKNPLLNGREQGLYFSVKITYCSVTGCNSKYCKNDFCGLVPSTLV